MSGIPVRNIWLLMLYASDLFKIRRDRDNQSQEENPEDIPNFVAEILAKLVEERHRRHLSFGYRERHAVLNRVRGRIDTLETERKRLLSRGLVACRFEDMTVDTARNRFVRAALETISLLVVRNDGLAHHCRNLANGMKMAGVAGNPPTLRQIGAERFARHDMMDRDMVAAAMLAFDLALPTESVGTVSLPRPDRDKRWIRRLFERAVGGFYEVVLSPHGWRVRTGKRMKWQVDSKKRTPRAKEILPGMQTDIELDREYQESRRRIVIDTKFSPITTLNQYRSEKILNKHLYQIYAYLRSQEDDEDPFSNHAEGLLLHPSVGVSVDESVVIQGHRIRFATVDLAADTRTIREDLLRAVEPADVGSTVADVR